ncbi:hypothetical protein ACQJBY_012269 [Aegilops geniculata]
MCAHATSGKSVSRTPQPKLVVPALMVLHLLVATTVAGVPVALPGCPEACGSVTVPYPFGFRQGCFHAGFNLTCDTTRHPPKLLLGDGVEVDAISLADGTVRVQSKTVSAAWSDPIRNGTRTPSLINSNGSWVGGLTGTRGQQLAVSSEHNVFVAIGCNFIGYLVAPDPFRSAPKHISACAALCDRSPGTEPEDYTSCSGVGCCWMMFKGGLDNTEAVYQVMFKHLVHDTEAVYPAWYTPSESVAAFIVDREWFNGNAGVMLNNTFGSYDHHWGILRPGAVPTVLIWWLEQERDRDIVFYDPNISHWRCVSLNSVVTYVNGFAIRCSCLDGYEGNPYMSHGCQARCLSLPWDLHQYARDIPMLSKEKNHQLTRSNYHNSNCCWFWPTVFSPECCPSHKKTQETKSQEVQTEVLQEKPWIASATVNLIEQRYSRKDENFQLRRARASNQQV